MSLNGSLPSRYESVSCWVVVVSRPCRWSSFLKILPALCAFDLNRNASIPNRKSRDGIIRMMNPTNFGRFLPVFSVMVSFVSAVG